MQKKLLLLLALASWPSYSYSESLAPYWGTTGNAITDQSLNWSMGNVLPEPPGLDIQNVIYSYTIQKESGEWVTVHVQNKNANGTGYIFRETDEWKPGTYTGMGINKVVPVGDLPRELWGPGSIEVEGNGSVYNAQVVYTYKVTPCYDPQFDPNCPNYVVPVPNIVEVNLDDLYDKKRESDEMKHQLYNRILNRIHERIKLTSRQKKQEQFCWYPIPEIMVGIPKYDCMECTSYILDKLHKNGFMVKYTHPNLVFISWKHHVPSYVRSEFKKKTGVAIDENGNKVDSTKQITDKSTNDSHDINNLMFNNKNKASSSSNKEKANDYKDIKTYKPSGSLIYSNNLLKKLDINDL